MSCCASRGPPCRRTELRLSLLAPVAGTLLLSACGPRGDAHRYSQALSESGSYEAAREDCAAIVDVHSRGDCLVAVMEQWDQLDVGECHALAQAEPGMAVWRDECVFQLAERMRARGRIDDALALCVDTRFARECAWHLVQDEAEASVTEHPEVAELRLSRFADAHRVPDAALQFWMIRFRAQAAADIVPDATACTYLERPEPCLEAFRRHVRLLLDAQARKHRERVCSPPDAGAATVEPLTGWVDGPVAAATVADWRARNCEPTQSPDTVD